MALRNPTKTEENETSFFFFNAQPFRREKRNISLSLRGGESKAFIAILESNPKK